jgi:hypothetical protein
MLSKAVILVIVHIDYQVFMYSDAHDMSRFDYPWIIWQVSKPLSGALMPM